VANEPSDEQTSDAPNDRGARDRGGQPGDGRYFDRNVANRFFPGPSKLMSKQAMDRIEGLLRPLDDGTQPRPWRDRKPGTPGTGGRSRSAGTAIEPPVSVTVPPPAAAPEDIAQLHESLEQQNELLRAILASTVDTQTDARSTAQNSRTFAWAGTAIALLTLIATVISIVAAVRAS
jgi:hypothetical protein